jgi:integrase
MLTNEGVRAAAPGAILTEPESPGLRLLVSATGRRSWVYRFKTPEGLRQVTLGYHPALTVDGARRKWDALREERAEGADLTVKRKQAKAKAQAERELAKQERHTVAALARAYLDERVAVNRKMKSYLEAERLLARNLGELGNRPAVAVERTEAYQFIDAIAKRTTSTARVLRQELRAAWNFGLETGRLPGTVANPWVDLMRADKRLRQGRGTRVLSEFELGQWLVWLPTCAMSQDVRDALEITLRTGVRSGEAVALRWRDLDLERGVWTLRPEDVKTMAGRSIRLPAQCLNILQRRRGVDDVHVFPSPIEGRHLRQHALVWAIGNVRKECPIEAWAAHDLRRSARTAWSRLGVPDAVAEAGLGHGKAGVRANYDLHRYDVEVAAMLARWNDHLDQLRDEAADAPTAMNMVKLKPKRQRAA